jgi:squalene cyclase
MEGMTATVNAARAFLRARQHPDGGWGYRTRNRDSFIEPTAWSTLALSGSEEPGAAVDRAVQFLLSVQNQDGGWPDVPGMPSDMMTARVVFALAGLGGCGRAVERGVEWIVRQELAGGGWGWCHGTTGFIETAAYAIVALAAMRRLENVDRLAEYVLGLRCADGGWCSHVPSKLDIGQPSQPSVTPLGVIALCRLGRAVETHDAVREPIELSLKWFAEGKLGTTYAMATALWSFAEAGQPVGKARELAVTAQQRADTDGGWRESIWHTAIMCYALRRLGLDARWKL